LGSRRPRSRDSRLRRLRHAVTVPLVKVAVRLAPKLSFEAAQRIGRFVGRYLIPLARPRVRRIREHLALAMPELPPPERARIERETLEATGLVFMEALWVPAWDNERDAKRISIATPELFDRTLVQANERGKGLIILSAHLGPWEILGKWFMSISPMPAMGVAAVPRLAGLKEPMQKLRESAGVKVVWRGEGGLSVLRHLRAGGCMFLLGDHNSKGEGIDVPFFGTPAHTILGVAKLAVASGAMLTTMYCYRRPGGRVEIFADEPLDTAPREGESRDDVAKRLVREYTARIETAIRRDPGQWLWMHRRWMKR